MTLDPWYRVVTSRQEVQEGRSFSPVEFAVMPNHIYATTLQQTRGLADALRALIDTERGCNPDLGTGDHARGHLGGLPQTRTRRHLHLYHLRAHRPVCRPPRRENTQ